MAACLLAGLFLCVAPLTRVQADEGDASDNSSPGASAPSDGSQSEKPSTAANTMLVQDDYRIDAKIVGSSDQRDMIAEGDMVFLNAGSDVMAPGMEGVVYRKIGKIKDKKTGDILGTQLRRVGKLIITDEVGDTSCTARITSSDEPIQAGDLVHMGK
jgi:hypothetical protein